MRMGYKKRRKFKLLLLVIIPAVVALWVVLRIGPVYMEHAASYVYSHANSVLNKCISDYLYDNNIEYDDFIKLYKDEAGNIRAVETDGAAVNKFKTSVTSDMEDIMLDETDGYVKIPLGSILGLPALSSVGPKITFKIYPVGRAEINLSGEFTDAGINQVCHSLFLDTKITYGITNTLFTHNETVDTRYLIGETVIVGEVPKMYGVNAVLQEENANE